MKNLWEEYKEHPLRTTLTGTALCAFLAIMGTLWNCQSEAEIEDTQKPAAKVKVERPNKSLQKILKSRSNTSHRKFSPRGLGGLFSDPAAKITSYTTEQGETLYIATDKDRELISVYLKGLARIDCNIKFTETNEDEYGTVMIKQNITDLTNDNTSEDRLNLSLSTNRNTRGGLILDYQTTDGIQSLEVGMDGSVILEGFETLPEKIPGKENEFYTPHTTVQRYDDDGSFERAEKDEHPDAYGNINYIQTTYDKDKQITETEEFFHKYYDDGYSTAVKINTDGQGNVISIREEEKDRSYSSYKPYANGDFLYERVDKTTDTTIFEVYTSDNNGNPILKERLGYSNHDNNSGYVQHFENGILFDQEQTTIRNIDHRIEDMQTDSPQYGNPALNHLSNRLRQMDM